MTSPGPTPPLFRLSTGLPVVISAPSGSGKSTVAGSVARELPNTVLSISCTTRAPRPAEVNGRDYHFLSDPEFRKRIEAGDFLEWAVVHGHCYGTPVSFLKKELEQGRNVLLTIDPQGAISVRRRFPEGVFIFLVPPDWQTLKSRLSARASDDEKSMEIRLANARKELGLLNQYDYLVVNDDLSNAVRDVAAIIRAEQCRLMRLDRSRLPILKEAVS